MTDNTWNPNSFRGWKVHLGWLFANRWKVWSDPTGCHADFSLLTESPCFCSRVVELLGSCQAAVLGGNECVCQRLISAEEFRSDDTSVSSHRKSSETEIREYLLLKTIHSTKYQMAKGERWRWSDAKLVKEDCPGQEYHVEQKEVNEPIRSWQDKKKIATIGNAKNRWKRRFRVFFPLKNWKLDLFVSVTMNYEGFLLVKAISAFGDGRSSFLAIGERVSRKFSPVCP